MNEPITNPHDKISLARDDYRFRMFMIETMTRLETKLDLHTKDDERRFEALEDQINNTRGAVSGISEAKERFLGGKDMLIYILGTALVVLGIYAGWPR